jgi:type IV secretory pathway VirB3-like protein
MCAPPKIWSLALPHLAALVITVLLAQPELLISNVVLEIIVVPVHLLPLFALRDQSVHPLLHRAVFNALRVRTVLPEVWQP